MEEDAFDRALHQDTRRDETHKLAVRFIAIGRAPILRQQIYKISSSSPVSAITAFLRTRLRLGPDEPVFVYLNDSFTPAPEENLLNLHNVATAPKNPSWTVQTLMGIQCFKIDGQLVFSYSLVPAFG